MDIEGLDDLIKRIKANRQSNKNYWYRGQANSAWDLTPKLARNAGYLQNEIALLKHFKQDAVPRLKEIPNSDWQWVFLAQHYGVPTRLLDWSENPLIALFFAVEHDSPSTEQPVDGALYELDVDRINSQTTGLPTPDVYMFDQDQILNDYLPENAVNTQKAAMGPMAAIASRSFDRISSQSGTFTVTHRDHRIDPEREQRSAINKLIVPVESKPMIREALMDLNIRASTVYPDLHHLADYVAERHAR